ncbi:MAG: hypothetical protein U0183_04660 [Polyangiaceae bacterium]
MATKKPAPKKPAPKKPAPAKPAAPKATKGAKAKPTSPAPRASARAAALAPLTEAEEATLLTYPATYDKLPDQSVPRIVSMAREVLAAARQAIAILESGTRITRKDLDALAVELDRLQRSEAQWSKSRDARVDPKDVAEGESLKADALAALDYWLEGNEDVETRVSKIREGTGIADLADDLEKLAVLLEEHASALKKADLVKGAPGRMRALAQRMTDSLTGKKADVRAKTLLSLRNRAFWALGARLDGICSAGRYAFRKEPRKAKLFASVATRKRVAKGGRVAKEPVKLVPTDKTS